VTPEPVAPVVAPPVAKPTVWPVFVGVVLHQIIAGCFTGCLAGFLLGRAVATSRGPPVNLVSFSTNPEIIYLALVASVLSSIATAFIGARMLSEPPTVALRLSPPRPRAMMSAVPLFIAVLFIGAAITHLGWIIGAPTFALPAFDRAVSEASPLGFAYVVALMTAGAGIGEELLFRGFVQRRLSQRWGRWPAILVSAALFGLIHFDPVQSTYAFAMGIALGWVADRIGSVWPGVAAHAANNLCSALFTRWHVQSPSEPWFLAVEAAGAAIAIVAVTRVLRASPPTP
jgi:membrane protease YdiL (CAAX protease family)